ncbi:MAG: TetR family transcriptional regulator [Gordonia sp.]|jgi:AcrR family transcriptional regulator|uniref:TetR-like C-terminal domain-containing protein n=1 Tax=Gordonia sp. (in: high G+C Gram-positive bacteria) TaxID=84139 RepID=UPI000C4906CB|nr:TetR-like C-terminal domain-containing protein [Gordonia sp. (in: high G+C Gram-positive bacteria)]MAU84517.1 TetR family transcriptional regulator [Gordonia sp. (in: high G+C Gram-positive bacteria)]
MSRSRRRGADLEAAIHEAVIEQLSSHTYSELTFEGVAAAAATSKAVLYRRWSTKAEMVMTAVAHTKARAIAAPDNGSLRADLIGLLRSGRDTFTETTRRTMLGVLADIGPDSSTMMRDWMFARTGEIVDPLLRRARDRGELGPTTIPPRAAALPLDLLRHETLLRGSLDDSDIADLVDQCLVPLYQSLSGSKF